jgi:hypothetical protein
VLANVNYDVLVLASLLASWEKKLMRVFGGLIIIVYCAGIANELAIPGGRWHAAPASELANSITREAIRALEWPATACGRIIAGTM